MPRRDTLAKRGRGQPSKLTPERADKIEHALRRGMHITTACYLAGVTTTTFYRWMHRAEKADYARETGQPWDPKEAEYCDFRARVFRARAEAAEVMVDVVFQSAVGGQLIREEPAIDGSGNPIRDDDGRVIMKREWTTPDGRLGLQYLKVLQPDGYGGGPERLEITGPGGGPVQVDGPEQDDFAELAASIGEAIAERKAIEAQRMEAEAAVEGDDEIQDAEIVDE